MCVYCTRACIYVHNQKDIQIYKLGELQIHLIMFNDLNYENEIINITQWFRRNKGNRF